MNNKNIFDVPGANMGNVDTFSNFDLTKVSAIAESIGKLNDFKHIFAVSDFTPKQIILISKLKAISEMWEMEELSDILDFFAVLQLSKERKSREEIVNILMAMNKRKKGILSFLQRGENDGQQAV